MLITALLRISSGENSATSYSWLQFSFRAQCTWQGRAALTVRKIGTMFTFVTSVIITISYYYLMSNYDSWDSNIQFH
jgi:hypothetical protein